MMQPSLLWLAVCCAAWPGARAVAAPPVRVAALTNFTLCPMTVSLTPDWEWVRTLPTGLQETVIAVDAGTGVTYRCVFISTPANQTKPTA